MILDAKRKGTIKGSKHELKKFAQKALEYQNIIQLLSDKVHFSAPRPQSRILSRISIIHEGWHFSLGNNCRAGHFRHKHGNPHEELKFLVEILIEVLAW